MSFNQQKSGLLTILLSLFVSGEIFVHALQADVFVDDSPIGTSGPAAVASDLGPVPAEEIAREVLRLQQQMGGSVVENRPSLQGWKDSPGPVALKASPGNKVCELREAAWQLDITAHRLEKLDLYDQADALRDVADRLRRDARKMKQAQATETQFDNCHRG